MDFDFDCAAAASPGGQWVGESASRRRQRRLSTPSLRAYLTPAFDAVAAGHGGVPPGSPASSYSSGGLELGFDASLLRYRRTYFSAGAELESRRLLYSPPAPAQARPVYAVPDHDVLLAEAYFNGPKRQVAGMTGAPGFPALKHQFNNPAGRPLDLRSPDATVMLPNRAKLSPTTTAPGATPSAQKTSSAQPQPTEEEDDLITEVLYGRSGRRRLPIFKDICPE